MSYQSCSVFQCFPVFCHALSRNRSINLLNESVDWFLRPRLLENIEIKEACDTEWANVRLYGSVFNIFISNAPFLYPLKTWCFQRRGALGTNELRLCIFFKWRREGFKCRLKVSCNTTNIDGFIVLSKFTSDFVVTCVWN